MEEKLNCFFIFGNKFVERNLVIESNANEQDRKEIFDDRPCDPTYQ